MAIKHKRRASPKFQAPGHYTAQDRQQIPAEDFGDPANKTFPIVTQQDLDDAARLLGHAADPVAVQARLTTIAKRLGLSLPAAWQTANDMKEPERMRTANPDHTAPSEVPTDPHLLLREAEMLTRQIAAENGYDVEIILRAKAQPLDDEADETPDDEGEEDEGDDPAADAEDAEDEERAADATLVRSATVVPIKNPVQELAFVPITRIDRDKWEVEGTVSDEQLDTFGTIFDFPSMQRAVETRWHGNVREQHDPKKAVGRGVWAIFDPATKETKLRTRVSRGAPDTWAKIEDGVLCGYSVGVANAKTETRMVGGKPVVCYKDFDLAEISLVDAPSNPGAARSGLTLYRAAGFGDATEDIYAPELDTAEDAPIPVLPVAGLPAGPDPLADLLTGDPELDAAIRAQAAAVTREISTDSGLTGYDQRGDSAAPAGIDHAALEAQMNTETAHAHTPHRHSYNGATVHENEHAHDHTDGTAAHAHRHMHAHSGTGDGSAPHVHLHEHGHQYSRAASDLASGVTGTVRPGAFIGQDDPRLADYLPRVATPAPQLVPVPPAPNRVATEDLPPPQAVPLTARAVSAPLAAVQQAQTTRVGARISADTADAMHAATDQLLRTCGCPRCQMLLTVIDPDQDGDDDTDENLDMDDDMARVQQATLQRRTQATIARVTAAEIQRQLAPITQQFRSLAARFATTPPSAQLDQQDRANLATIKDLVERIAATEASGPVMRAVHTDAQMASVPANLNFSPAQLGWMRQQNLVNPPTADGMTRQATDLIRAALAQQGG